MGKEENYVWPMNDSQVANILGIKNIRSSIRNLMKRSKLICGKDEDYFYGPSIDYPNSNFTNRMWTKRGAIKIASHSKKPKAKEFLQKIGVEKKQKSFVETDCIGIIIKAIDGFTDYQDEYYVEFNKRYFGHKVDLYLKDLNIAIECDEIGHEERDKWDEEWRENKIKETLGCKFIRFNPNDPNFNTGDVINQIFSEIIHKRDLQN